MTALSERAGNEPAPIQPSPPAQFQRPLYHHPFTDYRSAAAARPYANVAL